LKSSLALVTPLIAGLSLASALAASTLSEAPKKVGAVKSASSAARIAAPPAEAPQPIQIAVRALDLTKLGSADFADGEAQR
jgi:hypothetical protein